MWSLDDKRWRSLRTFFHSGRTLPGLIRRWQAGLGSPEAEEVWAELRDLFLHQLTITNAAYAVLPYMVAGLERVPVGKRLNYLVDLGVSEAARRNPGSPAFPDGLAEAYKASIEAARPFAIGLLGRRMPRSDYRWLVGVVCSVHGHPRLADLLFNLDCMCGECPKCGEVVYPDETQASGYC
jgi:hypothetical protein